MRLLPADPLVRLLLAAILLASLLPISGKAAAVAGWVSDVAIFLLFMLNGVRLPRAEVIAGMRNLRLMGSLVFFVFGVMALAGLGLSYLLDGAVDPLLALGFLYLGVLPSTVQSATAYTSIAKGNVAAAVVAAALLNLLGMLLTPLLFSLLAGGHSFVLSGHGVWRILSILLLPFLIGQALQTALRPRVMAHRDLTAWMDRGAIAIAVYVAFSAAVAAGLWSRISSGDWIGLLAGTAIMLAVGFGGAWGLGGLLRLGPADRRVMLFSGAQKSIAVGAPLATVLFTKDAAGIVLMPVLAYHLLQLVLSVPLAARLGASRQNVTASSSG